MLDVTPRQRREALLMLLVANFFWGLSFPLIKSIAMTHARLIPESGNWFITAWAVAPRFLLGSLVLFVWQLKNLRSFTACEWKQGIGLGAFAAAGMLFQTDGLQFTEASTSAFLTQLYAIMIPVFLAVRSRRVPPWTVWVSCFLVLAGVAILGRLDWRTMQLGRGELETLISSVFFMGQILWLERAIFAGNRVLPVTLVMFATEAAIFTVLAACTAPNWEALLVPWTSMPWLGFTLALTVFCTLGAFLIMNTFQPRITATEAGLIYCVEPVFGSMLALFLPALFSAWASINYPNEVATPHLLLGGGLITAANVLIQLKPLPKT
jgi:drug/metabolite transporter (DMT)-like permease